MSKIDYTNWKHPDYYMDKLTPEEENSGGTIYGSLEDYIIWYTKNK